MCRNRQITFLLKVYSILLSYSLQENLYLQRVSELEMSTERRNEMRKNFDMVRKNRFTEFMRGFSTITSKLKEMYQMITLGGDAELELVDSLDPFSEGINFRSACVIDLASTISGIC